MTEAAKKEYIGRAVENGVVRFLSVSALEKADPKSKGCYRRWHYRYVMGIKEPEDEKGQARKDAGTELHANIAGYLTGQIPQAGLLPLAMKGLSILPMPGPDLIVEHSFSKLHNGAVLSELTSAGVPLVGQIDCGHRRIRAFDGELDPPGTVTLIDWKRKGNAKTREGLPTYVHENKLIDTIQMAGYGEWVRRVVKDATHVRLAHGNFFDRGSVPKYVTKLHVIDDCARKWEYAEGVARTLVDIAREPSPDKVPGNMQACDEYRGCPYREICSAYKSNSLSTVFGAPATLENLFGAAASKELSMGLLSTITDTPPTAANVAPEAPAETRASLLAEEDALRAAQANIQQPPPPPPVLPPNPIVPLWDAMLATAQTRYGGPTYPALGGDFARAFADAKGFQLEGAGFAGGGPLGKLTIFDKATFEQLLKELGIDIQAVLAAAPPAPPVPPVPFAPPAPMLPPAAPPTIANVSMLPPGTPASQPHLAAKPVDAAPTMQQIPGAPTPVEEPKKRGPGRPKKSDSPAPTAQAPVAPTPAAPPAQPTTAIAVAGSQTTLAVGAGTSSAKPSLEVYVDCLPNKPYTNLVGYIDRITSALAERFCQHPQGLPMIKDVRCAPQDSAIGFGKWKGGVHALVLEHPPDGVVVVDSRFNEVHAEVAYALEVHCTRIGATFVKGIR